MDIVNHFFTRATVLNARAEYLLALIACVTTMIAHWPALNVWLAAALFAYIDLFSTVPGLVAFHMSADGRISKAYYVLYDVLHSAVTQGLVVAVLVAEFDFQWSFLAIPVHLCIDRGAFNNYPKPFGVAFDPVPHPAFERFRHEYAAFDGGRADWKAIKRAAAGSKSHRLVATGSQR